LEQSMDSKNNEFLTLSENRPMVGVEKDLVNDRWITKSSVVSSAFPDLSRATKQSIKYIESYINRNRKRKCNFFCLESNSKFLVNIADKTLISYRFDNIDYFDIDHVYTTFLGRPFSNLDSLYKDNTITFDTSPLKICCWEKNKFQAFNLRKLVNQEELLNFLITLENKRYLRSYSSTIKDTPKSTLDHFDIVNSQHCQYMYALPELDITNFLNKNVIYLVAQALSGSKVYLNVGETNDIFSTFLKLKEKDDYFGHECLPIKLIGIKEACNYLDNCIYINFYSKLDLNFPTLIHQEICAANKLYNFNPKLLNGFHL